MPERQSQCLLVVFTLFIAPIFGLPLFHTYVCIYIHIQSYHSLDQTHPTFFPSASLFLYSNTINTEISKLTGSEELLWNLPARSSLRYDRQTSLMEEGKQVNSENLSDGNDRLEEEDDDDLGTKRAYQCMFCKRGFTNAQALGGHMNIHRKQRPKAKHSSSVDSAIDSKTYEELFSSGYIAEKTNHHSTFQFDQRSYQMYYRPSQSNPRYPPVSYSFEHNFFTAAPRPAQPLIRGIDHNCFTASAARPQPLIRGLDQERLGENLSLGIGHNRVDENQEGVGVKSDMEVDLELRLGCHPC